MMLLGGAKKMTEENRSGVGVIAGGPPLAP